MIITCEKCSTSFNLDDALIKEKGTKVRCSRCKAVFTAYPKTPDELATEKSDTGLEPDRTDELKETESSSDSFAESEFESDSFELEDTSLLDESDSFEIDDDLTLEKDEIETDDTDFSMDTPIEKSPEKPSPGMPAALSNDLDSDDDFELDSDVFQVHPLVEGEALDVEPEFTPGKAVNEITQDESYEYLIEPDETEETKLEPLGENGIPVEPVSDFSEADTSLLPGDESGVLEEEPDFELDFAVGDGFDEEESDEPGTISEQDNVIEDEPPMITPENDFSEYDDVLDQETDPVEDVKEDLAPQIDETKEEEIPEKGIKPPPLEPPRLRRRRHKKKSGIGTLILILILLIGLVLGAYVASIITGYKIKYLSDIEIPYVREYIEKYVQKKPDETTDIKPMLDQKSVDGKFYNNETAGNLFVITGRVDNPSNVTFSHIEVKGSVSTKDVIEAKTKTVFCGNLITEEMLKNGDINKINEMLMVKDGTHGDNAKVKPGASIPFMVVFSDYPENQLTNFIVRVNSFNKLP